MDDIKKNTTLIIIFLFIALVLSMMFGASFISNYNDININQKEKININTATEEELMSLDGIGKVKANIIIENRPYQSIHDLKGVKGIGEDLFRRIESEVTVHAAN